MKSWRPTTYEPGELHAGIYDYLRGRTAQMISDSKSEFHALGRASVILSDGREMMLELNVAPVSISNTNSRSAIAFDLSGHAALDRMGYEVRGNVVLDQTTLAFLNIEAELTLLNKNR